MKYIRVAVYSILLYLITSCDAIKNCEEDTYYFIHETKVLLVKKREGKIIYCESPTGHSKFKITDHFGRICSDTVYLNDQEWVYDEALFIKKIPYGPCKD